MRKIRIIALLLTAVMLLSACASSGSEGKASQKERKEPVQRIEWTPVYNDHQCGIQANRTEPEGLLQEALTEAEIRSIVPAELLASMKTTGSVSFKEGKTVYDVVLQMRLQEGYAMVHLGDNADLGACCMSIGFGGSETKSQCGALEYTIFRQIQKDGLHMLAFGNVNGIPVLVRIDSKNAQNDKIVFERILESFSRVKGTSLTLSEIKPG